MPAVFVSAGPGHGSGRAAVVALECGAEARQVAVAVHSQAMVRAGRVPAASAARPASAACAWEARAAARPGSARPAGLARQSAGPECRHRGGTDAPAPGPAARWPAPGGRNADAGRHAAGLDPAATMVWLDLLWSMELLSRQCPLDAPATPRHAAAPLALQHFAEGAPQGCAQAWLYRAHFLARFADQWETLLRQGFAPQGAAAPARHRAVAGPGRRAGPCGRCAGTAPAALAERALRRARERRGGAGEHPRGRARGPHAEQADDPEVAARVLPYYATRAVRGKHLPRPGAIGRMLAEAGFADVHSLGRLEFPMAPVWVHAGRRP